MKIFLEGTQNKLSLVIKLRSWFERYLSNKDLSASFLLYKRKLKKLVIKRFENQKIFSKFLL